MVYQAEELREQLLQSIAENFKYQDGKYPIRFDYVDKDGITEPIPMVEGRIERDGERLMGWMRMDMENPDNMIHYIETTEQALFDVIGELKLGWTFGYPRIRVKDQVIGKTLGIFPKYSYKMIEDPAQGLVEAIIVKFKAD